MKDHTLGEIKLVRGSGPPILTVEGEQINVGDRLYILGLHIFRPALPKVGIVIGIDLTKRTVRFQIVNERELIYSADGGRHGSDRTYVFSTSETSKLNAVNSCKENVKEKEHSADRAIDDLEKAKRILCEAEQWSGDDSIGAEPADVCQ